MMILATKGYYQWEFQDPNMEVLYQKSQVFKKNRQRPAWGLLFLSLWDIRRTFGNRRDMKMNIIPLTHPLMNDIFWGF